MLKHVVKRKWARSFGVMANLGVVNFHFSWAAFQLFFAFQQHEEISRLDFLWKLQVNGLSGLTISYDKILTDHSLKLSLYTDVVFFIFSEIDVRLKSINPGGFYTCSRRSLKRK